MVIKMNKYVERKNEILAILSEQGSMTNSDIEKLFDISPASARRLCAALEADGSVIRRRGGIRVTPQSQAAYSFELKSQEFGEEKIRIAKCACESVHDDDVVFLEAGTTVYQCAVTLAERISEGKCKNVTVFTNSLNNLRVLSPVTGVLLVGGEYRPARQDFVGYLSERFLRNLCFDHAFIGVDAIDEQEGLMVMDADTARLDEVLLKKTASVSIVAHSDKFGKRSLLPFGSLNDVDNIITDTNLDLESYSRYSKFAAEIIRV